MGVHALFCPRKTVATPLHMLLLLTCWYVFLC